MSPAAPPAEAGRFIQDGDERTALAVLDESDGFDDPMIMRACDYLQSIARSDDDGPFVLPSAGPYPRAPWWKTEEDPASSLLPTAGLAVFLHKHAVDHPWVEVATDFCWRNIDGLEKTSPYEVMMVLQFLENVDDRARAEESFARIGPMIDEQVLAGLDPQGAGARSTRRWTSHPGPTASRDPCSTTTSFTATSTISSRHRRTMGAGGSTGRPGTKRRPRNGARSSRSRRS